VLLSNRYILLTLKVKIEDIDEGWKNDIGHFIYSIKFEIWIYFIVWQVMSIEMYQRSQPPMLLLNHWIIITESQHFLWNKIHDHFTQAQSVIKFSISFILVQSDNKKN
jgi:hypothetical protein